MKKKKVISILLTGVLLTGMLAGCGAKGEESASKDKETIEFWYHDGNANSNAIFEKLIAQFEEENPEYKVEYVGLPSDSYLQKYNTAIATNTVPDVASIRDQDVSTLINQGALSCVEEDFNSFEEKDHIAENALNAIRNCSTDGKLYCLPQYTQPQVYWYNTTLMKEKGVEIPKTIDEFMQDCETYADADNGTYFYSLRGGAGSLDNMLDFIFTYANQDQLFDEEGNCVLSDPIFTEALEAYASIYWNGWTSKDSVSNSYKEMVAEFGSGTAMGIANNSSALAENINNLGEGNFTNALAPANKEGVVVTKDVPFLGYTVFEGAKNREGGVKFLEFLVSHDAVSYFCEKDGRVPVNDLVYEDEWYQDNTYMPVYEEMMSSKDVKFLARPLWLPEWNEFLTKVQEPGLQAVLLKEKTAEEVLQEWAEYLTAAQKGYLESTK
ncbi:sugar ABC transporter substrate-binding protein [Faecalicatena acetigenes]|uniref:Sugar ABC transporter substrate-binding protein n=1 Tax=Faecalicatena acetigenes TaxID=2981790 RepID=A0ABT2TB09_9FIRM|nr:MULTISPECIES: sugar ABC transporter substrate-binding protein [Lachnospiraceae]MCU6747467.1 sugar ABC transporter substrate-binding protein [Faecalicatena acetigenes]SCH91102.1 Cyclodextrin-binding protein precursor [uncultured Clostridium sp.]